MLSGICSLPPIDKVSVAPYTKVASIDKAALVTVAATIRIDYYYHELSITDSFLTHY